MNASTDLRPEITAFLVQVRAHLADLPEEEREELLDGLEADLSEQLAEGGLLPAAAAYAAELRAAAGLAAPARAWSMRRQARPLLDVARERGTAWTQHSDVTRRAWSIVELLRPAWWVLRAWIAVTLLDQSVGPWEYVTLWPTLGAPFVGPVLLVVAVAISILIGQNRLWPGSGPDRSTSARLLLVALNALAVLALLSFNGDEGQGASYTVAVPVHTQGKPVLHNGGDVVRNIYAYDAQGQPLQGVQLFDQEGRPVAVAPRSSMGHGKSREVVCPWFNGATPLFNVYPLPQRLQRGGTCLADADPAGVGQQEFHVPPLASVPPVTSPVPH